MTLIPIPRGLAFLFPNGQPMDTGQQNFMAAKTEEEGDAVVQSAQKIQNLWEDMQSTLAAEIMVPLGDPEELALVLDQLSAAAAEMAALLRK
jgi:hypothetical protein